MPAVCSACTTPLSSESDRPPYSRLQSGPRHHSTTTTPTATAAATPSSVSSGRRLMPSPLPSAAICLPAMLCHRHGVNPSQKTHRLHTIIIGPGRPSDRHVHDVHVGADQPVAYLRQRLKGHRGLLRLHHHMRQVHTRHA